MRYFIVTYRQTMVKRGPGMQPQTDEVVSVAKRIRMRDSQSASVILDFSHRKVLQATLDGVTAPKDFQKIRDFYHQHYPKIIEDLEQYWQQSIAV